MMDGSSARQSQTSVYVSIEFTLDGRFFIEKTDNTFEDGTYEVSQDRRVVKLDNFGTIEVVSLSEISFSFKLTPQQETAPAQEVSAVSEPIALSENDEYLLGSWAVTDFYYVMNGDTIQSDDPVYATLYAYDSMTVYFTPYGTYFVEYQADGATQKVKNF